MGTSRRVKVRRGQALIEYAVLVSAVILGMVAAVNLTYRVFSEQAQDIEEHEIVF